MSTPAYPMRRALHLRLQAGLDDLELAAMLHGVAVDRLHCFELGEMELAPHELDELAEQLALRSAWHGAPEELRELVGPDGATFDLVADAEQMLGVIRVALTAELERRLALASEVRELLEALPPATDERWANVATHWRAAGGSEAFARIASGIARDADARFETFLYELSRAVGVRRAA